MERPGGPGQLHTPEDTGNNQFSFSEQYPCIDHHSHTGPVGVVIIPAIVIGYD